MDKRQTCEQLLRQFRKGPYANILGEKIIFKGVGNKDVYNITAPFEDGGTVLIAGRVEQRDSEFSQVLFFTEEEGVWYPKDDAPSFKLQDPFVTKIHGELIFGGVEIFPNPENQAHLSYRTTFYRGKNIYALELFAKGPDGMKDIRLIELEDGNIGVFTRPQGEIGGRGKIGYTQIETLEDLTEDVIERAFILDELFIEEEWGGANELHLLSDGSIGVLGHIACFDEKGNRHYYPMVFKFNPNTMKYSSMKLIATRDNFPKGPAKRPDLIDVVFSGGLIIENDDSAVLYVGVSDAEACRIDIPNPFI